MIAYVGRKPGTYQMYVQDPGAEVVCVGSEPKSAPLGVDGRYD
jgi:hypothetical protein